MVIAQAIEDFQTDWATSVTQLLANIGEFGDAPSSIAAVQSISMKPVRRCSPGRMTSNFLISVLSVSVSSAGFIMDTKVSVVTMRSARTRRTWIRWLLR